MLTLGAFLSTLLPLSGPAVVALPARSATLWLPVAALAVSVPVGTLVLRVKLASAAFASPDPPSLAVQAMLTSLACHRPSALPHDTPGGVLSTWTVRLFDASWFPALSVAEYVRVVTPSLVMAMAALLPGTVCEPLLAPASENCICCTPEPP